MCTVTYCLNDEKIVLTSNRDERIARPTLLPSVYQVKGKKSTVSKRPRSRWYLDRVSRKWQVSLPS